MKIYNHEPLHFQSCSHLEISLITIRITTIIPKNTAIQASLFAEESFPIIPFNTYLKGKDDKRDYTAFVVGINVGLRASDLLKLKVSDVRNLDGSIKDNVTIVAQKTNKVREFNLNRSCSNALKTYLKGSKMLSNDDYLFLSGKGKRWTFNC
ncbi:tyrosine-type recombinase/integrase [Clostridium sporogenes]|uniref:tyrosine-type recombinase/integrase n=1 Tax=Clostridium TaxID=1485 RepID=UPI002237FBD2|nr:tyrosine-type recombinase/integrase [Clostridium sporogenes]MCW6074688.1 tyrosine-type recombinase/integrase [Clostridium sporogenes]